MAKLNEYYGHFCESEYEYAFIGFLEQEGWKYVSGNKFFDHILKRDQRKKKNGKSSSILKGSVDDLIRLKEQAYNKKVMKFRIFIVQPGMSKKSATDSMRILLGNTYKFLIESANIPLKVICSQ